MMVLPTTLAVLAGLVAALLCSRANVLALMYTNSPNRLQRLNSLEDLNIRFTGLVRNCEDAVLDTDAGFALLSCDPGRDNWNTVMGPLKNSTSPPGTGIYIWHYSDSSSQPEKLKLLDFGNHLSDFHPLGIEYQAASKTIIVVNHARASSRIEMFQLFAGETSAAHIRSLEHPLLAAPNSVLAISENELMITNDHHFSQRNGPVMSVLETYSGLPGGSVTYVKYDPKSTSRPIVVQILTRLNFANGIILLNASTIAVASSGLASVTLYTIETAGGEVAPRLAHYRTIRIPFHADNLSVDDSGKLLIAGHPHAPSLEELAKNSARCNGIEDQSSGKCDHKAPSAIAEWSEQGGLVSLYLGLDYQSSTTALRDLDRNIGIAVGLYEKGILTWTTGGTKP